MISTSDMKFDLIVSDPPWEYQMRAGQGIAQDQYGTMSNRDLTNLRVGDLAADDCMMLLWTTTPKMPAAVRIMKAWGFQYKTVFLVWLKTTRDGTTAERPGATGHDQRLAAGAPRRF